MEEAIERSCNTYFYTLVDMLDIDAIKKYASAFGLGELSGIDPPARGARAGAVAGVET